MIICDRCHQPFFDYEGYEEVKDEGVICSYCLDEEVMLEEERESESRRTS
jgi:uncharacterized Zn finger protein (UPF0148 family)